MLAKLAKICPCLHTKTYTRSSVVLYMGLFITRRNDYGARSFCYGRRCDDQATLSSFLRLSMKRFSASVCTFISSFSLTYRAQKAFLFPLVPLYHHFLSQFRHGKPPCFRLYLYIFIFSHLQGTESILLISIPSPHFFNFII